MRHAVIGPWTSCLGGLAALAATEAVVAPGRPAWLVGARQAQAPRQGIDSHPSRRWGLSGTYSCVTCTLSTRESIRSRGAACVPDCITLAAPVAMASLMVSSRPKPVSSA